MRSCSEPTWSLLSCKRAMRSFRVVSRSWAAWALLTFSPRSAADESCWLYRNSAAATHRPSSTRLTRMVGAAMRSDRLRFHMSGPEVEGRRTALRPRLLYPGRPPGRHLATPGGATTITRGRGRGPGGDDHETDGGAVGGGGAGAVRRDGQRPARAGHQPRHRG